jgi:flagellar basal-body rod protein FlgC
MKQFLLCFFMCYTMAVQANASNAPYIVPHTNNNTDNLKAASKIAISGMEAQSERLKIISQNIANVDVTGTTPNSVPYKRKIIFFENKLDNQVNAEIVKVKRVDYDKSDFILKYQPHHPAANAQGYVAYPNVNIIVETADAQEAQRSFDVNTNSMEIAKSMQFKVLELMK